MFFRIICFLFFFKNRSRPKQKNAAVAPPYYLVLKSITFIFVLHSSTLLNLKKLFEDLDCMLI